MENTQKNFQFKPTEKRAEFTLRLFSAPADMLERIEAKRNSIDPELTIEDVVLQLFDAFFPRLKETATNKPSRRGRPKTKATGA